jgi:hypothetical protein
MIKKRLFALLTATAITFVSAPPSAYAIDSFDYGVGVFFGTCVSKKVPGTFALQYRTQSKSWATADSGPAWDDRQNEGGTCPTFAVGGIWTPNVGGLVDLRIINTSNHKVYFTQTVKITGAPSATASVAMPNLVGAIDGNLNWWLSTHGYKFRVGQPQNTGYNAKISCLMSGKNVVLKQSPARGTMVPNSSSTRITIWVNCQW